MKLKHWLIGSAAAFAVSVIGSSIQAAPASGPAAALKAAAAQESSAVEKAAYRRCWRYHGRRHCRWYRDYDVYPYYDDYPYYYAPYYGPSFGFFYGGGRFRHGGHHGHRHR
jgi:hypothetical protein